MYQRRFWSKNRDWVRKKKRPRKVEFNAAKRIYEPVELEKDVVKTIVTMLWYCGIPVFIQPEVKPKCQTCGAFVAKPSDAGQPDLHGWVPTHKLPSGSTRPLPFYIECKRPVGGIETEVQKEFIRRACRDGVLAFFANGYGIVRQEFEKVGVILPLA